MRAFGRMRIPVFLASPGRSYISKSRWYRPAPGAAEDHPRPSELADYLKGLSFERAVLVPCADDWVRAVASLRPDLRQRFPASIADPSVIDTLMDKAHLAAELERRNLPHPRTVTLASASDVDALPEDMFENAFLKPRDSLSFLRRYGRKAIRVRDRDDARRVLDALEKDGSSVVLQEFIPGSVRDHYFIEGFADRDGRVRARFARQRLRIFPPEFGRSTYTVSVPLDAVAPALATVDALFSDLRYRGVFSAEFVRDPRDGVVRLLEVNVRPYEHVEFAAQCGIDLAGMAYRDALGIPVDSVTRYAIGRGNLDLYGDLLARLGHVEEDGVGLAAWLRSYLGADGLTFAWDDPAPALRRIRDFVAAEVITARRMRAHR